MAKNEQLEAKIIQVAEELFMEKGSDATSTTDIAKKVGCNQALVHYYYRTKENLFFQIFTRKFNLLMSYIQRKVVNVDSLEQVIGCFIDFYFTMLTQNRNLPFFMINEMVLNPERRRLLYDFLSSHAGHNSYYRQIENLVQEEVNKGNIRQMTALMLILNMVSLIVFTFISLPLYSDFFNQDEKDIQLYLEQRKEEIKTLIVNGIFLKHD